MCNGLQKNYQKISNTTKNYLKIQILKTFERQKNIKNQMIYSLEIIETKQNIYD